MEPDDELSAASEKVSAFLKELYEEEGNLAAVSTAASFKIKRPRITENSIPTKTDIDMGGFGSCIICLKPLSMLSLIHI